MADKQKNLRVGLPEVNLKKESKFHPSAPPMREANTLGTPSSGNLSEFNRAGKSTNTAGSDYHDPGRATSGLHGNFAEKDANRQAMIENAQKGQRVHHWSGNQRTADLHTHNTGGLTAYNSNPIPEVFGPATSHGVPGADPVVYKTKKKSLTD
jgi:hypothetical protein